MIAGRFHQGSGLGNQLHRYVFARVKALDLKAEFGMIHPDLFKGSSFMDLDMGIPVFGYDFGSFIEKRVNNDFGVDVRPYDESSEQITDNNIVDGEFQDERYWKHREGEVKEWLKVEFLEMADGVCVIGFRGGEYALFPELFLTKEYWYEAIGMMREINPKMKFHVVTDDPELAGRLFPPDFTISHEIGMDWRMVRYAKYLIIANSSFYIFPALFNENVKKVIAPKFWARRNLGFWALPQNKYSKFHYI